MNQKELRLMIEPGDQVYFEFSKLRKPLSFEDGYYTFEREVSCRWLGDPEGKCVRECECGLIFDPPLEPDGCVTWGGNVPPIRDVLSYKLPDVLFEVDI